MISDEAHEFLDALSAEVRQARERLESDPWPLPLQGWAGPIPYVWESRHDGSEPNVLREAIATFDCADLAVRTVLMRVLVATSMADDDWSESRHLWQPAHCREVARTLLRTLDVGAIAAPEHARWELAAAAWAGDLDRVLGLVRRLQQLSGMRSETSEICARTLYRVLAHPLTAHAELGPVSRADEHPVNGQTQNHDNDRGSGEWLEMLNFAHDFAAAPPLLDERFLPARLRNESALSLTLDVRFGMGMDWITGLPIAEAVPLRMAAVQLLDETAATLDPTERENTLIRAWAGAASATVLGSAELWDDAGQKYLGALQRCSGEDESKEWQCGHVYQWALACFERADNWSAAESTARHWRQGQPTNADAARAIAKACHKQEKEAEALEAYEDYVRLVPENGDSDWVNTLLLKVGLEASSTSDVRKILLDAAARSDHRRSGEMILGLALPWFEQLTAQARERWWAGVFMRTLGRDSGIGEQASVDIAADCFGEVVNFELRQHVLYPFVATCAGNELAAVRDDTWRRIIDRRPTLGDCINAMIQSERGVTSIARGFNQWLWRNQPDLASHFKRSGATYQEMNRIRGAAQHGNVSSVEADVVMRRATEILAVVRRQPAAPAQDGLSEAEAR